MLTLNLLAVKGKFIFENRLHLFSYAIDYSKKYNISNEDLVRLDILKLIKEIVKDKNVALLYVMDEREIIKDTSELVLKHGEFELKILGEY